MYHNHLHIENFSFAFEKNKYLFTDLNYDFYTSDIIGLFGKNGCGKTTFLNCLSGLYRPISGKIFINNKSIEKMKKDIAIISTEFDLFYYLTIWDNIEFFLEFYKKSVKKSKIEGFLKQYEIYEYRYELCDLLSRGILRKTQIVVAFLLMPILMLADEPLDGLDEQSQNIFWQDVNSLTKECGTIVIFSLHFYEMMKRMTKYIIRLDDGGKLLNLR